MAPIRPSPISAAERMSREQRVTQVARRFGFEGRVEYRHVYSQAGGALYGLAVAPESDLLIVYADAFERDDDPEDFTLEAIIAHERGHQLLARHDRLARNLPGGWSEVSEEVVASLLGSLLVIEVKDQQDLVLKALFEASKGNLEPDRASVLIMQLRALLEKIL